MFFVVVPGDPDWVICPGPITLHINTQNYSFLFQGYSDNFLLVLYIPAGDIRNADA